MSKSHTTPRRRRVHWTPGLVVAVPLAGDTWGRGQTSELMWKNVGYLALFSHRLPSLDTSVPPIARSDAISLIAVDRHALASGRWPLVSSSAALFPKQEFPNERFATTGYIGATILDHGIAEDFLSAYHGLIPWNGPYADEAYLDRLLLAGCPRPATARILSAEQRLQYRKNMESSA